MRNDNSDLNQKNFILRNFSNKCVLPTKIVIPLYGKI